MSFIRDIWHFAAKLTGVVLLVANVPAAAQTITNVAEASWRSEAISASAISNEVVVEVTDEVISIDTFRPTPAPVVAFPYTPTICGNQPLDVVSVTSANAGSAALGVEPTKSLRVGDTLVFRITSRSANRDPSEIESIVVTLTTPSGDEETVTIWETGEDTGEFVGAIRTTRAPPEPVQGDCVLSVHAEEDISVEYRRHDGTPIVVAVVALLADPYGFVFDSQTGLPVNGAIVTLIDVATGQPAKVFADDGVTPWPSTVISGQPVTDGSGTVYAMEPGEYRFPLAAFGNYRLQVDPPTPYSAPSEATASELAALSRPDGTPFVIVAGSFGGLVPLSSMEPVRVDIPLDRPIIAVSLSKSASRAQALPGDAVFYTITIQNLDSLGAKYDVVLEDTPSEWLRLRRDTIRVDGEAPTENVAVADDGGLVTIHFDEIAAGATHSVTYAMVVRADAPPGQAMNRVNATDRRGDRVSTSHAVRIERETIGSRMTLIGRVTEGDCKVDAGRRGIPGVRLMLEDGSFAITDADGRYHFEGLLPGSHVVQAQQQTLPEDGRFVDCSQSAANAGATNSRFVRGQGGSLVVADFHAVLPDEWSPRVEEPQAAPIADAEAAGGQTDWLALGDGPTQFLFPGIGHNPRAPAVRVVIRHEADQTIELKANGVAVDRLAFDGKRKADDNSFAISRWRGIMLDGETTEFSATVRNADGTVAQELTRIVNFAATAAHAEILPEQSSLVADGSTNPVIAVKLTDRNGRPVRSGLSGSVNINSPYESAKAIQLAQSRQLSGIAGASPTWVVDGDDGVALIELAPTMVSGPLQLRFTFNDGEVSRHQEIDSWIVPGQQKWTLVGLVEGSIGARTVAEQMERTGSFDSDLGNNARVAFYAKGRVLGRFLLTASYDSAKQREEERLTGAIDPNAYYTVFADSSVRRFDAASREKLYIRIETENFYAIYGDFLTGFEQTQLANYHRAVTGVKAEGRFGSVHVQGFATETETRYRRDEIQGNGLSGPYRLSSRAIVANSETVTLETRDRFRSELIVETRRLERFLDYDIDLLSGSITFREPVLSRDFDLNPQFLVIEYEVDELSGSGEWNAGLRADVTLQDGRVRLGATIVSDKGDGSRTNLVGSDIRYRPDAKTEIRAEMAASRSEGQTSSAWLVEAERHSADIDVLAYVRNVDPRFGTGQQNAVEQGRRKIGIDGRYRASEQLSLVGSAWRDDSLVDDARRDAVQVLATWRAKQTEARLGLARFADRLADGSKANSTVLEAGATQRLLNNRLEISASTSVALQAADSIALPSRHQAGLRYALSNAVRLVGSYEVANGNAIDARTLKGGFEFTPWNGARLATSFGQQDISEYGQRSFAAFGLSQSYAVSEAVTVDATIDTNMRIGGTDLSKLINPLHPSPSGGHIGQNGELAESFTAVTLGASFRSERWSATARGEYRDGEFADRKGVTFGAIRQLGEGRVMGSGFSWTQATALNGAQTEIVDATLATAHRPADSRFALLGKLEYRSDSVIGAVAGEVGPAGRTALLVDGAASSRRVMASLSMNWSPHSHGDSGFLQASEFGLFLGGRYNFDSDGVLDLEGLAALVGIDARYALGENLELGWRTTVRSNLTDGYAQYAFGPEIGIVPVKDVLIGIGYNFTGFQDRDYSAVRHTESGIYANMKMKFDAESFEFLGLSGR